MTENEYFALIETDAFHAVVYQLEIHCHENDILFDDDMSVQTLFDALLCIDYRALMKCNVDQNNETQVRELAILITENGF